VLALAAGPAQASGFSSPSGNIQCFLGGAAGANFADRPMVCLIFQADWPVTAGGGDSDPSCDLDSTRTLVLPPDGPAQVSWSCHGDVFWPAPLGEISYGAQWSDSVYTCSMATDGVRCENGQGNGFAVRRAARKLY